MRSQISTSTRIVWPRWLVLIALVLTACSAPAPTPPPEQVESITKAQPETSQTDSQVPSAVRQIGIGKIVHEAQLRHAPHPTAPPGVLSFYHSIPPVTADRERYPSEGENGVRQVADQPVSTFSIDVDTAAYANARRQISSGKLPHTDSIRVEEFINYFDYGYPAPNSIGAGEAPFSVTTELGPSPWNPDRKLMLVGLQGYELSPKDLPPANLVFLVDVSGSMNQPNKLALLKSSLKMLAKRIRAEDRISIAVYAGAAGQVLPPTTGNERQKIIQSIDTLHAGGSTNGGAGINLAYKLAEENYLADGINRVILATDGDFNVGTTGIDALRRLIEEKRRSGISLTVLGFGAGNYNDALMQELAQKGNGNAAYIDSINEARKVLVDEMSSTLQTIAKDVKVQVEFNPAEVSEYRLIGYETRALKREDFNNDRVDAGDIGAGHSVTALYELTLSGAARPAVDELRYGSTTAQAPKSTSQHPNELATVKLRYKEPQGTTSKLLNRVIYKSELVDSIQESSDNFRLASAASAFGQLLRNSKYMENFSFADALELARSSKGADEFGYRHEFEQLLRTAAELAPLPPPGNRLSIHTTRHSEAIGQ